MPTPREIQERIAAERRGAPFLLYSSAEGGQQILDLAMAGERVTIGRRPTNTVSFESDEQVSRVHAELERVGDDWVIVDDGLSHNGTWVNGERVISRRRLDDGDVIVIGAHELCFRAPSPGSTSSPTVTAAAPFSAAAITPAQRRVLLALCRPFRDSMHAVPATNQQIADELFVSVDAVKSNLRGLFSAFGVDDLPQNQKRATLAQRALASGAVAKRDL